MALFTTIILVTVVTALPSLFATDKPPCAYPYTKFVYSGCFVDSTSNRTLPFQTDLDFNSATVEQCTAYCKGNNYRYAGLDYHGQCFCGASVSAAMAPETDCSRPCTGNSTQVCRKNNRLPIYQDPTFLDADGIATSADFLSLGCYTEGYNGRSLDYSQGAYLNTSSMTTKICLNACGAKGFPYAGTERGRECYCGVILDDGTDAVNSTECSIPCSGNSTEVCGGQDRLSLYLAKNLDSTEPCGPVNIYSSRVQSFTPPSISYRSPPSPTPPISLSTTTSPTLPSPPTSLKSSSSPIILPISSTSSKKSSSSSSKTTISTSDQATTSILSTTIMSGLKTTKKSTSRPWYRQINRASILQKMTSTLQTTATKSTPKPSGETKKTTSTSSKTTTSAVKTTATKSTPKPSSATGKLSYTSHTTTSLVRISKESMLKVLFALEATMLKASSMRSTTSTAINTARSTSTSTARSTAISTARSISTSTARSTSTSTARSTSTSTARSTSTSTARSTSTSTAMSTVKSTAMSTVKSTAKATVNIPQIVLPQGVLSHEVFKIEQKPTTKTRIP